MKRILLFLLIPFLLISCNLSVDPILKKAADKINGAYSYQIKYYSKQSFNLDTSIFEANPYIKHFAINDINYKNKKLKYQFFENINSKNWFDFTLMDGNNWYIGNYNENGKYIIDTMNLVVEYKNFNHLEDFKSNFSAYKILFQPFEYINAFSKWKFISEEKINNSDTWLFEYNFDNEQGFKVKYKLNISKADTFLSRFTVICTEYEKLHEILDVYTQLDIISHKTLNNNDDTIFDIKNKIHKTKTENKITSPEKNKINIPAKDTAKILINSNFITMNGDSIKLSSLKGKWILVDFWYVGCYPCYKAMDFFNKINQKYKNSNFVIYGINPIDNDRKALSRLFNDKGLTYQYLIDPKGKCRNEIGISGFPRMFLISPDQKIVWQHFGYTTDMDAELEKIITDKMAGK